MFERRLYKPKGWTSILVVEGGEVLHTSITTGTYYYYYFYIILFYCRCIGQRVVRGLTRPERSNCSAIGAARGRPRRRRNRIQHMAGVLVLRRRRAAVPKCRRHSTVADTPSRNERASRLQLSHTTPSSVVVRRYRRPDQSSSVAAPIK